MIGGIAQMTTLINDLRQSELNVFLFDSGDIFTGALAKRTQGQLSFELMITMGYDAMTIGNHEFEFGVDSFEWAKNRAPFPVLGANFFYADTDHPFAQAHTIIERDGIRIGVIGIMGQDARTAITPSNIAALNVTDPAEAVQKSVNELRDQVDLIVLLTHQGKTAPMQTDAETDPRLQRDIDADINLADAVEGIDILLAGHADAGTPEAVISPKNGTLIMQTYGQATHLGYLQLTLDDETGQITSHDGKLIPVESNKLEPDQRILAKLTQYRDQHSDIFSQVGSINAPLIRRYIEESDMGNLFTDIMREAVNADIAVLQSGSMRKDIVQGEVRLVDILDAYPFVDSLLVKELDGDQIRRALEQSLTFERGILQLSGLEVTYDLSQPNYNRIVTLTRDGETVTDSDRFTVAAGRFLAEGGDYFVSFAESDVLRDAGNVSDAIVAYFQNRDVVAVPERGRQLDISETR
ncbi:MAG: bifunctional UDP-sugar hydrolase/5'-nucleotidase [Gammaproteobacteria bacterium]|nr:bifunctional UDP-sugar hydrolase/5'-nucleotidase [Gammaproteobacteria bacterium]